MTDKTIDRGANGRISGWTEKRIYCFKEYLSVTT